MNTRFKPYLNRLLMELIDCWQRKTPELLRIEAAYMITLKHWKEVRSECWQHPFECDDEEIDFFRNIKCHFTGRLAYYTILYEALTSAPQHNDASYYWLNELERYERFRGKNHEFLTYLATGEKHMDERYFLRQNSPVLTQPLHAKLYDGDPEFSSPCDHLVSAYFAENLYRHFVLAHLNA